MHVSYSRLLCAITVILLLAACSSSPRPATPPTVSTQAVLSTSPADGATAVSVDSDISVTFSEPVKRASFKLGADIFPGRYDPDSNPASFASLELTALCDGKKGAQWQVSNSNDVPISFTWTADKSSDAGVGVVPAQSNVTFTSGQRKTLRLYVNGEEQASASPSQDSCAERLYDHAYSDGDTTATLLPKAPLAEDQWYTVVLSTRVRTTGNERVFDEPYIFSFNTSDEQDEGTYTPELQAYVDAFTTLNESDIDEIEETLLNEILANPAISNEELDSLAYDLVLQRFTPVPEDSLSTQGVYDLFVSAICDKNGLNLQECYIVWNTLSSKAYSFPLVMSSIEQFATEFSTEYFKGPKEGEYPYFEDAFRHSWWMGMVKSRFGEDLARLFGYAHECQHKFSTVSGRDCFDKEFAQFIKDTEGNRLTPGSVEYNASVPYHLLNSEMDLNNNEWGLETWEICEDAGNYLDIATCYKKEILDGDGKDRLLVLIPKDELDPSVYNQPGVICQEIYSNVKGYDTVCLIPFKDHPQFAELVPQYRYRVVDLGMGVGPTGLNDLGQFVGLMSDPYIYNEGEEEENTSQGFVWQDETFTKLSYFPFDINNNGDIAGTTFPDRHAVRNGAELTPLVSPSILTRTSDSKVWDINEAGTTVGDISAFKDDPETGRVLHLGDVAYAATGSRMIDINPGNFSLYYNRRNGYSSWVSARGINDKGQIVGVVSDCTTLQQPCDSEQRHLTTAVLWDSVSAEPTAISVFGDPFVRYRPTYAQDINNQGQVIGFYKSVGDNYAFLWHDGQTQSIGLLGRGALKRINNSGQAVGRFESSTTYSDKYPVLWEEQTGLVDINDLIDPDSGWSLNEVTDINDQGVMVGYGSFESEGSRTLHGVMLIPTK